MPEMTHRLAAIAPCTAVDTNLRRLRIVDGEPDGIVAGDHPLAVARIIDGHDWLSPDFWLRWSTPPRFGGGKTFGPGDFFRHTNTLQFYAVTLIPRLVLVGPENPRNIGFVARALKAFGATDLVIVASPWTSAPAQAYQTGTAAPEILAAARFMPTLADALRGCADAIAFSRRPTTLRQNEFTLPNVPPGLGCVGITALVFGRESQGLTREEASLCPRLGRIPCHNGVSLNLGQAVSVALFALLTHAPAPASELKKKSPPVALDRILHLWAFLEPQLAAAPRFTPQRLQRIRQMLYRLSLDDDDYDLLFATMNELTRRTGHRTRSTRPLDSK